MILSGCTPTPLLSYLKALGVLRLIANPSNNVLGRAADVKARGFWKNGCFHLHSTLNHEALLRFLLDDYAPSPIISPWNGGSGFYPGDNRDGFQPLTEAGIASRFAPIATAIQTSAEEIKRRGFAGRPKDSDKSDFVASLRGRLSDEALDWLDAALSLSGDRLSFPQLLGTGGNDGRLDFTNNFMRRLVSTRSKGRHSGLFDATTGQPVSDAKKLLSTTLFAHGSHGLQSVAVGQFAPGAAGGPNASTGYEGRPNVNPWDFVLALEGAMMFAGAATRRHQGSQESGASFPFTVRTTGAGWGGVAKSDEDSARAEFWAPLWSQPVRSSELMGLLREGRAVLGGKTAHDGLDFARAAASLGVSRGVTAFERYGFVMRAGRAYLATPLGSRYVETRVSDAAGLINDLDAGRWLGRIRGLVRRENVPARAQEAVKRLEDALFAMTEASVSPRSVQAALGALGDVVAWVASSRDAMKSTPPPPRLSHDWVRRANDGTPEYRVAAALAGLGWRDGASREAAPGASTASNGIRGAGFPGRDSNAAAHRPDSEKHSGGDIAMATHFAPVDLDTIPARQRRWGPEVDKTTAVWGGGGLEANLIAVLERRLIRAAQGLEDKPLGAPTPARLADVAAFFEPGFDDECCARLLAGLVWARPARARSTERQRTRPVIPFAYSVLKPIFAPDKVLHAIAESGLLPPGCRAPVPPGLIPRLRHGDVVHAVRLALARMRASGVSSPFHSARIAHVGVAGTRLAAALLIPLDEYGLKTSLERAYPAEKESENVA